MKILVYGNAPVAKPNRDGLINILEWNKFNLGI
jgi:hypothetical protein